MNTLTSFFRAVVLTVAFAYVFVQPLTLLDPVITAVIGVNPIVGTLAAALVAALMAMALVWHAGLVKRAEGKRGMLGLSLLILPPIGGVFIFGIALLGLRIEGVEVLVFAAVIVVYIRAVYFILLGVSLNRLLFALSEDNGETGRLPAAMWHKPALILCLAMFFGKTVILNPIPVINLLGGIGSRTDMPAVSGWIVHIAMLAAAAVVIGKTRMNERLADNWGFYIAVAGGALHILLSASFWLMLFPVSTPMPMSNIPVNILLLALSFLANCLLPAGMIWIFLTLVPDE